MINRMFRQGDMCLTKINKNLIPANLKAKVLEGNKVVVGLGEVTGHRHEAVASDDTVIVSYVADDSIEVSQDDLATMDKLFFEVTGSKGAILQHNEHGEIFLEEGCYIRINQKEYDPNKNELRIVAD